MAVVFINVNEILCYLNFNYPNCDKETLVSTISSFFHEKEIVDAKTELFKVASEFADVIMSYDASWAKQLVNNKGQLIMRRGSEDKSKEVMDTEDVVYLFSILDDGKVEKPMYVARNLLRVPLGPIHLSPVVNNGVYGAMDTNLDLFFQKWNLDWLIWKTSEK